MLKHYHCSENCGGSCGECRVGPYTTTELLCDECEGKIENGDTVYCGVNYTRFTKFLCKDCVFKNFLNSGNLNLDYEPDSPDDLDESSYKIYLEYVEDNYTKSTVDLYSLD